MSLISKANLYVNVKHCDLRAHILSVQCWVTSHVATLPGLVYSHCHIERANRYGMYELCLIRIYGGRPCLNYVLLPWPLISTRRTVVAVALALNIDMYGVWCYGVIAGSTVKLSRRRLGCWIFSAIVVTSYDVW
ncbi:hypothetical protein F4815DRAFT_273777 [Daldinia loculata]|nr:hypothetical protein F4815DRAFT_273777 [Daldinia loculata]